MATHRARVQGVVLLLVALGCSTSPAPNGVPSSVQSQASGPREVTLYLPGMNAKLQIL